MESNARLVKWSDQTYGIYIGNDYYDIEGHMPENQFLFTAQVSFC